MENQSVAYKLDKNLWEYALKSLSPADILTFCQVSKWFGELCKDKYFWQQRILQDFGPTDKPEGISWPKFYLQLAEDIIRSIPVECDIDPCLGQRIGYVWVTKDEHQHKTLNKVIELFKKKFGIDTPYWIEYRFFNLNSALGYGYNNVSFADASQTEGESWRTEIYRIHDDPDRYRWEVNESEFYPKLQARTFQRLTD